MSGRPPEAPPVVSDDLWVTFDLRALYAAIRASSGRAAVDSFGPSSVFRIASTADATSAAVCLSRSMRSVPARFARSSSRSVGFAATS